MLYSYFFDIDKSHRIEMDFKILNLVTIDINNVSLTFKLSISEYINNELMNSNSRMGTFIFTDSNNNMDINFDRVRIKNKWIFTATNGQKTDQTFSTGLISDQTNINPLGVDIINNHTGYIADIKGNTLAILEQTYVPPEI